MAELSKLLRLLGSLGPQLHHAVYQGIAADDEDDHDGGIPPAIVIVLDVQPCTDNPRRTCTGTRGTGELASGFVKFMRAPMPLMKSDK